MLSTSRCFLGALACVLVLAAPDARATALTYLSLEDLARRSDACVLARVSEARVGWNADHTVIVTTYTLEPESVLAGTLPPGSLQLSRVGGEIDGLELSYEGMPELAAGETAAVFLLERAPGVFIPAGLRQGVLHEREGLFVRDLIGVEGAPVATERLALDDLRRRVAAGRPGPGSRP